MASYSAYTVAVVVQLPKRKKFLPTDFFFFFFSRSRPGQSLGVPGG